MKQPQLGLGGQKGDCDFPEVSVGRRLGERGCHPLSLTPPPPRNASALPGPSSVGALPSPPHFRHHLQETKGLGIRRNVLLCRNVLTVYSLFSSLSPSLLPPPLSLGPSCVCVCVCLSPRPHDLQKPGRAGACQHQHGAGGHY